MKTHGEVLENSDDVTKETIPRRLNARTASASAKPVALLIVAKSPGGLRDCLKVAESEPEGTPFPLPNAHAMIRVTDGGSDVSPDSFQVLSFWSPSDLRNGILC